jgi:hypothetical protein
MDILKRLEEIVPAPYREKLEDFNKALTTKGKPRVVASIDLNVWSRTDPITGSCSSPPIR